MEERRKTPAQLRRSKDWTPTLIAVMLFLIFAGANFFVFTHELPKGSETLIARVLGTIDSALGIVLAYYFVSSSQSEAKTETIAKMVDTAGKQQAATDKAAVDVPKA